MIVWLRDHEVCPVCNHTGWCGVSEDGVLGVCHRKAEGAVKVAPGPIYYHVLERDPCPVCRGTDGACSIIPDSDLACCRYVSVGSIKVARDGRYLHPLADDSMPRPRPRPARPLPDWSAAARARATSTSDYMLHRLARQLGLASITGLRATGAFWSERQRCYCWPMRRPDNRVVSVVRRWSSGRKRMLGSWGLVRPETLSGVGVLHVVEGPTDTVVLADRDVDVLGKPSNRTNDIVSSWMREHALGRDVVVWGENDRKPSGHWPGRDGAEHTAEMLQPFADSVEIRYPPRGQKDVRAWLTQQRRAAWTSSVGT